MMTIREAVKWGAKRLRDNNVDNADHDSILNYYLPLMV